MARTEPFVTTDERGRREMNLEPFCRALAAELGYLIEVDNPGSSYPVINIDAGNGLTLRPRAEYGAKVGRVEISAGVTGAGKLEYYERPKTPSATVDSSRPIDAIAKDVLRRIVEPCRAIADETRAAIAKRESTVNGLAELAASLNAEYSGLSVTHSPNEKTADVYFNKDGMYLNGTIDATGRVNIQHFSVSSVGQTRQLFALIAGKVN